MSNPQSLTISAKKMQKTLKNILLKHHFPKKRADECAVIFTQNSIDGIYTHGINRFPRFVQYIQKGYVIPEAKPTLVHRFGGIEQWNGNLGAGPSNAIFATERAMKLASKIRYWLRSLSQYQPLDARRGVWLASGQSWFYVYRLDKYHREYACLGSYQSEIGE